MSPAMHEAARALDMYRDAIEVRVRFETAHAGRELSKIKLAAMRADELHARRELETAFRLALELGSVLAPEWPESLMAQAWPHQRAVNEITKRMRPVPPRENNGGDA